VVIFVDHWGPLWPANVRPKGQIDETGRLPGLMPESSTYT